MLTLGFNRFITSPSNIPTMRLQWAAFHLSLTQIAQYIFFLIIIGIFILTITTGSAVGFEPDTRPVDELDGSGVYTGEELRINLSDSKMNLSAGEVIYLVRFTDRPSFTVEDTATVNKEEVVSGISTDELPTGEEYAFSNSTSSSTGVIDGEFSLLDSEFSAGWDTDAATGETTDGIVDISSSRDNNYALTVSAEEMEYEELNSLFSGSATVTENPDLIPFERLGYEPADTTAEDVISDGYITLTDWNTGSDELNANFSALKQSEGLPRPGEYNFEFVVADTGKKDTSTIDIAEKDEDASLDQPLYEIAAGDIVTAEIELEDTEETFIQISDENGFADVVYVDIDDPDEPITLQINTRVLGTDYRSIDGLGGAYEAENVDRLISAYHDGQSFQSGLEGTDPFVGTGSIGSPPEFNGKPIFVDSAEQLTYQEYLTQSGYIESENKNTMINRPLQPTNYQIEIAGIANVGEEGIFNADKDGPTDRIGQSTMVLVEPTISNISVYQLSEGDAGGVDDIEDSIRDKSPTENISNSDRIAVRVDLTGIFGAIAAGGPNREVDTDRIENSFDTELITELRESNNGFDFSIEEVQKIGNQKPSAIVLDSDSDASYAVSDYSNKRLYIIINTQSPNVFTESIPSEKTLFNIKAKYEGNITDNRYRFKDGNPLEGPFSSQRENANYPFLPVGEEHQVTQTFSVGPPKISYNNKFDDEIQVIHTSSTSLNGTTNLRTGTEARIVLVSENPSNVVTADLNIDGDEFTTEPFNGSTFANRSAITIRHVVEGEDIDSKRGRIVEEYGSHNNVNNLVAENSESGTSESVTSGSNSESDPTPNSRDKNQGRTSERGDNIRVTHLLSVALISFITGTMIGAKYQ